MIADVIDLLRCPHCAEPLSLRARGADGRPGTAGCAQGHRFDVARQGQLNLLRSAAGATADTADMVADRAAFLASGHYAPVAELVARSATGAVAVETGAGTGYYLSAVLAARGPQARGVATDLSAYACRRSAKLPRVGAVVADTWAGLPLRTGVADTVLTVFAPRNWREFARIATPSGRVLVVTPQQDHLGEVRRRLGLLGIEDEKHARLLSDAAPWLTHAGHEELRYRITLPPDEVAQLIGMGPNAFHGARDTGAIEEPVETTVAVRLDAFRPR